MMTPTTRTAMTAAAITAIATSTSAAMTRPAGARLANIRGDRREERRVPLQLAGQILDDGLGRADPRLEQLAEPEPIPERQAGVPLAKAGRSAGPLRRLGR